MSSGGGGGGTQVVEQRPIPPEIMPYVQDVLQRGAAAASMPYEPYGGSRLAYFSPAEQTAQQAYIDLAGSALPSTFLAGRDVLQSAAEAEGYTPYESGYQVGFDPGTLSDAEKIEEYMNPYTQLVLDRAKQEARRQSDITGRDVGLGAAGEGSLGGYREAIIQSERLRNLEDEMTDIQTSGMERAYTTAVASMEADRAARAQLEGFRQKEEDFNQSAAKLNELSRQFDAGQKLELAQSLYDAGLTEEGLYVERLARMEQAGASQRAMEQASLDMGYQDFVRQQAYPLEQLGILSNLVYGAPFQPGSIRTGYDSGPSTAELLAGLGLGGLGAYYATRGNG